MYIYKITSLIDGKIYVGQTTRSLDKRIAFYKADICTYKKGKYKARSKIIAALSKYGIENFKFEIIDQATSQEDLNSKEQFWIKDTNSCDREIGFNIQLGGFGVGKHSDETKKIMSEKKIGKPAYNKDKQGLSEENVGNSVLTQKQANKIREEYKIEKSCLKLAKKYNTSKTVILHVLHNKTYKDPNYIFEKIDKPWYVYLIQSSKDETIYTGITKDVDARLKTHNEGRGARYTRGRGPFFILKSFQVETKSDALKLEYKIKQLPREEKLNYNE
jgi:putative endonuclease